MSVGYDDTGNSWQRYLVYEFLTKTSKLFRNLSMDCQAEISIKIADAVTELLPCIECDDKGWGKANNGREVWIK